MAKAKAPVEGGEKKSLLEITLEKLNAKYGAGSLVGAKTLAEELEVVDTGSISLNAALGCGGYPLGKLIEIQGPFSSGKSTLTLHAIAEFQKKYPDKEVLLLDYEQSFSKAYALAIGVNMNKLIVTSPECAEDGYNMIIELIKTDSISLVVIDSHTAALPKVIVEGEVGISTIAVIARVNSTAIGKIKPLLAPHNCTLIAISQQRVALGGYTAASDSTGGNAFKFYCDIRMKVSRQVDKEKNLDKTSVLVNKNKCGLPFSIGAFTVCWGKGIDRKTEIVDAAVEQGRITKGGAGWFTLAEGTKLQGMEKVKEFFDDNPEYYQELEKSVLENLVVEVAEGLIEE